MSGGEVDPLVIQRTQQKLGKHIQRPQLTEKLLKRPPFRFLHDIVTAAMKQYGVMEGVFAKQELVSDNIKEKEDKIAFLQKLINHIVAETGIELQVKPSKIVAGTEAEKTNELLQALANLLEKKQQNGKIQMTSSDTNSSKRTKEEQASNATVTKTNGTTNNKAHAAATPNRKPVDSNGVQAKPAVTSKVAENSNKAVKTSKDGSNSKQAVSSTNKAPAAQSNNKGGSRATEAPKTRNKPMDSPTNNPVKTDSSKAVPTPIKEAASTTSSSIKKQGLDTNKTQLTTNVRKKTAAIKPVSFPEEFIPVPPDESVNNMEGDAELVTTTNTSRAVRVNGATAQQLSPEMASSDSGITLEHPPSATLIGNHRSANDSAKTRRQAVEDDGIDAGDGHGTEDDIEPRELSGKASAKIGKLSPPRSALQNAFEKPIPIRGTSPVTKGNTRSFNERPASGNNGSQQRPKSSRRPPSRTIRDRLATIRQDSSSRPITGQVPRVIVEGNTLSDDEEDRIVRAAVLDQAVADLTRSGADELLAGEQGKLVEQILSAQKELGPLDDSDIGGKDMASSTAEVQHLKRLIQEMAQSALPLGQLIPLIHEDMEIMQHEWQVWKREADHLEEEFNRESAAADRGAEKIRMELEQMERAVQDQESKLNAARAALLRGESDVELVITSVGKKR